MKKVLTLSALGCLATVGAVFAVFTLDPSTETEDISVANVDVDLSAQVFSKFDPVDSFTYVDEVKKANPFLYDGTVPVADPEGTSTDDTEFRFGLKAAEGGGHTLDLKCVNSFNYEKWLQYVEWRVANQEPDPNDPEKAAQHAEWVIENEKKAPRGYAFKYEYDESFLAKIEEDDTRPDIMKKDQYKWMYPIYKTNFSAGLTESGFKADELIKYGITYVQPDKNNPDYKLFDWDKSDITSENPEWRYGNDSFYILPDMVEDPVTKQLIISEKSGTMIFNGKEMTKDLFSGTFADKKAIEDCATYLENNDNTFSMRLKATEYFRTNSFELEVDPDTSEALYLYNPDDSEVLETNTRHSFSFTATDTTEQLLNGGYQLDGFCILGVKEEASTILPLINTSTGTTEDLFLKVTKKSANGNGTEEDITDKFTYINDTSSSDYGAIRYTGTDLDINAGDVITISFLFRKDNGGMIKDVPFGQVALKLAKKHLASDDQVQWDGDASIWYRDYTDTILGTGVETRFRIPLTDTAEKVYPNTFKIINNGTDIVLKRGDVQVALLFEGKPGTPESLQYDIPLDSTYFTINTEGTVTVDVESILEKYTYTEGSLDMFKLGIAVKNRTDVDMPYTRVECTSKNIPVPEVLEFDPFTSEGDGGFFVKKSEGKKLVTGQYYEAVMPIGDDTGTFYNKLKDTIIPGLEGGAWNSAQFALQILGSDSKPLSFGDEGSKFRIKVTRFNSKKAEDYQEDTDYYYYDGTENVRAIATRQDKTENINYLKDITSDITSGYDKLKIRFVYNGTNELEFNQMQFTLNLAK